MFEDCSNVLPKILIAGLSSAIVFLLILFSRRNKPTWANIFALVLPLILFWVYVDAFAKDAPYYDDYSAILEYLSQPFPNRLLHLFDFHNEHRLFTSRIIFESIYAILGRFDFRVCMFVGDLLFLMYLFLLGKRITQAVGVFYFIPFVWLFLDILNWENTIWAMTAVSNQVVFLFAFISFIFFTRRTNLTCFIISMVSAVVANYTTGAGLFVWPALGIIAFKQNLCLHKVLNFRAFQRAIIDLFRDRQVLLFLFLMVISIGCYFIGFKENIAHFDVGEKNITRSINVLAILGYFLAFCGNVAPGFIIFSMILGAVVLSGVIYVVYHINRVRDDALLAMLFFALGSISSAAWFRNGLGIGQALAFRYEIVALTLMACTFCLFIQVFPKKNYRIFNLFSWIILLGAISINFSSLILGWELIERHNQNVDKSIQDLARVETESELLNPAYYGVKHPIDIVRNAVTAGVWQIKIEK